MNGGWSAGSAAATIAASNAAFGTTTSAFPTRANGDRFIVCDDVFVIRILKNRFAKTEY